MVRLLGLRSGGEAQASGLNCANGGLVRADPHPFGKSGIGRESPGALGRQRRLRTPQLAVGADRPNARRCRIKIDDDRARGVLVSSADRPFKGDEETFDPAGPDAALDFDGGDRLELPALSSMLVQHLLKLAAGHLAADHALAELDHCVLVAVRHATTIAAASA